MCFIEALTALTAGSAATGTAAAGAAAAGTTAAAGTAATAGATTALQIGAAASLASAAVSTIAGMQSAKAQSAQQAKAMAAERERARNEMVALRQKEAQEKEQLARDVERIARKSKAALSTAATAAGEAGMTGVSVDALMDDFKRQELEYMAGTTRQSQIISQSYDMTVESAASGSYYNQVAMNRPVSTPSFLEIPLAAANAYGDYAYRKAKL